MQALVDPVGTPERAAEPGDARNEAADCHSFHASRGARDSGKTSSARHAAHDGVALVGFFARVSVIVSAHELG
jgi:hypothetical protein